MENNQTMKASELRIGNLLSFSNNIQPDKIITVGRRFFSSASIEREDGDFNITPYYNPIPLTEEWLLRMGFEVYEFDNGEPNQYRFKSRLIVIREDSFCDYGTNVKIKYVHQLQNLYFALTGQELEIKES